MGAFKNKYNPLLSEDIQITPKTNGLGNQFLADDGNFKPLSYSYKGAISVNTEFPLKASVQIGDWYNVTASVTDNAGATYTNTGLTFTNGDDIFWNGSTWLPYGNAATALVEEFECTVGAIGGQYTTLKEAIDAGKTRILVISNTTEVGNITLSDNFTRIKGHTKKIVINLNGNTIISNNNTITGENFLIENITITTGTSPTGYAIYAGTVNTINTGKLDNCIINVNSAYSFTYLTIFNITDCIINISTSSTVILLAYGGQYVDNLIINRTVTGDISFSGNYAVINNVQINGTANDGISFSRCKIVSNIYCISGVSNIYLGGDNTNIIAPLAALNASPEQTLVRVTNGTFNTINIGFNIIANNLTFNSIINNTLSFSGMLFNNCIFSGEVILTGDFNKFQNCIIGSSGAKTITINAGADYNTIIGCTTGLDIEDNGTGSEMWANTKFL